MLCGIYSVIYGEVNVSVEKCVEIKGDYVEKNHICFISVTLKSWSGRKLLDPTAYSVGSTYSCWILNCWCITWPVGFKSLSTFRFLVSRKLFRSLFQVSLSRTTKFHITYLLHIVSTLSPLTATLQHNFVVYVYSCYPCNLLVFHWRRTSYWRPQLFSVQSVNTVAYQNICVIW